MVPGSSLLMPDTTTTGGTVWSIVSFSVETPTATTTFYFPPVAHKSRTGPRDQSWRTRQEEIDAFKRDLAYFVEGESRRLAIARPHIPSPPRSRHRRARASRRTAIKITRRAKARAGWRRCRRVAR